MATTHARTASDVLGVVLSWDFGTEGDALAVRVPRSHVATLLTAVGLDAEDIAPTPDLAEALARAAREVKWGSRVGASTAIKMHRLPAEHGVDVTIGVLLVETSEEDASAKAKARIRVRGDLIEVLPALDGTANEVAIRAAELCRDYAIDIRDNLLNTELSKVLTSARVAFGCISMRQNAGGVYFLPAGPTADRALALLDGLEAMTESENQRNRFFAHTTIVRADARNVATWSRVAQHDLKAEIEELETELKALTSKDSTRESTFEKKVASVGVVMRKAESLSHLLEGHLGSIKDSLSKLEREFGSASEQARKASGALTASLARLAKASPVAPVATPARPTLATAPKLATAGASPLAALSALKRIR